MRGLASSDVFVLSGWHDLIYWQLLLLAKCAGIATVGFYESTLETQTRKSGFAAFFRSLFFRSLDAVVTPGIAATEALSAMGLESRKIVQGFNAIDVELFSKTDSDSRYTQNPGHNFIFVGRLIALKNVGNIIRAFESVADSEDRLTIVGDGECKNSLRNLTAELGLQDRVNFLGSLNNDELPAVLARQSTLILVSSTEVWGLVVNEALASGLHVVVGRNCGVSRSVAHMRGVFITEIDIDSISTAMARSRSEWMGRISDPEILRFSPIEFAECFKLAIQKSIDGRSSVI
ncbi:glycosyltransferase involved in cell wall biosynthesis [Arthrobacter silviterrae]|uniref:D-inositol 3-phosphate glycosyltransferase n=1 Tax=Arthrobacter silviterrae TaxID=2026658 RepID=A0ABX0D9M7_9MICC|nr:glycosyltransferase [Arthrobacter silviterrae]MDQ0279281.1 glycosyltransferase involved in cell wall biosynthesis [Arthrobacter silviterrae]NGN83602.1 glycosyltransferase family 4 protein [Arthrobacter silviterrae]